MEDTSAEPIETWHVELGPGDVRVLTLEQLDLAFEAGVVGVDTRVWQEGMSEAVPLGELLGGDDDEPRASEDGPGGAPAGAPPGPVMQYQRAPEPTLIGLVAEPPRLPESAPSRATVRQAPQPAASSAAWPPVVSRAPAAASPAAAPWPPPPAPAAPPPVVPSVMPLAMDLGDDLEFPRAPRRGRLWALMGAAGLLAGGAVFALGGPGSGGTASAAVASPVPVAPPTPPKSNAYDPGDAPVKLREAPPPLELTTRQTEEEAGRKAGKVAPAREASSGRRQATSRRPRASGKAKDPFRSSGRSSSYDPLNGAL